MRIGHPTQRRTARGRPRAVPARRSLLGVAGICTLLGTLALVGGAATAYGGFTGGTTGAGTFRSGTGLLSDTIGGTSCLSSANGAASISGDANTSTCATYPLSSTIGGTSITTVADQGSVTPTSASLATAGSCGVQSFGDTSSTTFADTSSTGTDTGTPQGGVAHGAAGPTQFTDYPHAASFNGSTGYVQTATQTTGPQTFTEAGWFRTTSTSGGDILGFTNAQGNSGQNSYDRNLWLDPSGAVVAGVWGNNNYAFELKSSTTTSKDFADGAWHFAAFTVSTVNSTTATLLLYVDGTLVDGSVDDETNIAGDVAGPYTGWWHVGFGDESAGFWPDDPTSLEWSGSLADVAVFPTALTAAQITTLYGETTQSAESTQVLADAPTSYWTLGDMGGQTGLAVGGVTYGVAGPTAFTDSPAAASFDGSTGSIETLNSLTSPTTYSFSAWFKTSSGGPIIGFASVQSTAWTLGDDRALWVDSSGHVVFYSYPNGNSFTLSSSSTTAKDYADGSWHQAVLTMTPTGSTTGTALLYVDGTKVAGSTNDVTINTSAGYYVYSGYWHVGGFPSSGAPDPTPTNFFNGSLADVAVYPSALSAAQVTADGPTSYWSLQDTGTSLYTGAIADLPASSSYFYRDSSHNPGTDYGINQGTIGYTASGPLGDTAAAFNGTNEYVDTANPVTGPQTFSIAAWFKTSSAGGILTFDSQQTNGSVTGHDRMLWVDNSGHLVIALNPGSLYELNSSSTTTKNYADGAWHLVVVTVSPASSTSGTVELYADGSLVAGSAGDETITGSDPAQVFNGYWTLGWMDPTGWSDSPTDSYWSGSLGQIAVFGTALSAANVTSLYGEGTATNYLTAVTGGVASSTAYWPLDETAPPSSPACSYVAVDVSDSANCLYPYSTGTCTGVTSSWLSATLTLPTSLPSLTFQTVSFGSLPTAGIGLHVSVPWLFSDAGGGFTASILHNQGYVLL